MKRFLATFILIFYSAQNVMFCHAAETSVWAERAQQRQSKATPEPMLLAQLPNLNQTLNTPFAQPSLSHMSIDSPMLLEPTGKEEAPVWLQKTYLKYANLHRVHRSNNPSAKTLLLVQDIHLHTEAQKNIADLITSLGMEQKKHGLLVGLEGADVPTVDFSSLAAFPHRKELRQVAMGMLNKNILSGAEFAGAGFLGDSGQPGPVELPFEMFGIEDMTLYQKDVTSIKEAKLLEKESQEALKIFDAELLKLKAVYFNKALNNLDAKNQAYNKGDLSFSHYLTGLNALRPFSNPHLVTLFEAIQLEESLNFKAIEQERAQFIRRLAEKLSAKQTDQIIALSLRFKEGELTASDYYKALSSFAEHNNCKLNPSSELNRYIQYVIKSDSLSTEKVFAALKIHEESLENELAVTEQSKAVLKLSKRSNTLHKLAGHSLTEDEWKDYQRRKETEPSVASLFASLNQPLPSPLAAMESQWKPFEDFYEIAIARNDHMANSMANRLAGHPSQFGVLVAGGFHTNGLESILLKMDLNLYVLSPKISQITEGPSTIDILASNRLPVDQLFSGERLFIPLPLSSSSGVKWDQLKALMIKAALALTTGTPQRTEGLEIKASQVAPDGFSIRPVQGFQGFWNRLTRRRSIRESLLALLPNFAWLHTNKFRTELMSRLFQHATVMGLIPILTSVNLAFLMTSGAANPALVGFVWILAIPLSFVLMIFGHEFAIAVLEKGLKWAPMNVAAGQPATPALAYQGKAHPLRSLIDAWLQQNSGKTAESLARALYPKIRVLSHNDYLLSKSQQASINSAIDVLGNHLGFPLTYGYGRPSASDAKEDLTAEELYIALVPVFGIAVVQDLIFEELGLSFRPTRAANYDVIQKLGLNLESTQVRIEEGHSQEQQFAYATTEPHPGTDTQNILRLRLGRKYIDQLEADFDGKFRSIFKHNGQSIDDWVLARLALILLVQEKTGTDLSQIDPKYFSPNLKPEDFKKHGTFDNVELQYNDTDFFTVEGLLKRVKKIISENPGKYPGIAKMAGVPAGVDPKTIQVSLTQTALNLPSPTSVKSVDSINSDGTRFVVSAEFKGKIKKTVYQREGDAVSVIATFDDAKGMIFSASGDYSAIFDEDKKEIKIFRFSNNNQGSADLIKTISGVIGVTNLQVSETSILFSSMDPNKNFKSTTEVWILSGEKPAKGYSRDGIPRQMALSPRGDILVFGDDKSKLTIVDLNTKNESEVSCFSSSKKKSGDSDPAKFTLKFSPSGRHLLLILPYEKEMEVVAFNDNGTPTSSTHALTYSPDAHSKILFSRSEDMILFYGASSVPFIHHVSTKENVIVQVEGIRNLSNIFGSFIGGGSQSVVVGNMFKQYVVSVITGYPLNTLTYEMEKGERTISPNGEVLLLKGDRTEKLKVTNLTWNGLPSEEQAPDVTASQPTETPWWNNAAWLQVAESNFREEYEKGRGYLDISEFAGHKTIFTRLIFQYGKSGFLDEALSAGITKEELLSLLIMAWVNQELDPRFDDYNDRVKVAIIKEMVSKIKQMDWWQSPIVANALRYLDKRPDQYGFDVGHLQRLGDVGTLPVLTADTTPAQLFDLIVEYHRNFRTARLGEIETLVSKFPTAAVSKPASFLFYLTQNKNWGMVGMVIEWAFFVGTNVIFSSNLSLEMAILIGVTMRGLLAGQHYYGMRKMGISRGEAFVTAIFHFSLFSVSLFMLPYLYDGQSSVAAFLALVSGLLQGGFDAYVFYGKQNNFLEKELIPLVPSLNSRFFPSNARIPLRYNGTDFLWNPSESDIKQLTEPFYGHIQDLTGYLKNPNLKSVPSDRLPSKFKDVNHTMTVLDQNAPPELILRAVVALEKTTSGRIYLPTLQRKEDVLASLAKLKGQGNVDAADVLRKVVSGKLELFDASDLGTKGTQELIVDQNTGSVSGALIEKLSSIYLQKLRLDYNRDEINAINILSDRELNLTGLPDTISRSINVIIAVPLKAYDVGGKYLKDQCIFFIQA